MSPENQGSARRLRDHVRAPKIAVIACFASFGLSSAGAEPVPLAGASPEPRFAFVEVRQAYAEAGEDGVKSWMKQLLKRAKASGRPLASGVKPKCGACHENLRDYPPRPNAASDLRALLAQLSEPGD